MAVCTLDLQVYLSCSSSRQSAELQQQVTEEDILQCIRVILPVINVAFNKSQELFSGDPATTLKVSCSQSCLIQILDGK